MIELKITHYAVGQGLCVVVSCTYPGGKCLAILDMGTTYPIDSKTAQSIEDINAEIRNNNNSVQCVLISHLDSDHFNLFEKLTDLNVLEKVIVGGTENGLQIVDESKYSLIDALFPNLISRESVDMVWINKYYTMQFCNPYFSILGQNPLSYVLNLTGDIKFCLNVLAYRADLYPTMTLFNTSRSSLINSGSTIALITLLTNWNKPICSYLFTGDATNMTLNCLNEQNFRFDNEYKAVLIPHHGSMKNIYDTAINRNILDVFLACYQPNAAFVSAKCLALNHGRRGWVHPHYNIIQKYRSIADNSGISHMVTSFSYDRYLKCHMDAYSEQVHSTHWSHSSCYPSFVATNIQLSFRVTPEGCEQNISSIGENDLVR